jgi:plasmid stabilization system protein ParE
VSREFRYHPAARAEARRAVEFYRAESVRIAEQFLGFLDDAIQLVVSQPLIGHPVRGGCRRKVFTRFPYSLIYRFIDGEIQIVAVMHHRRKPEYWLTRVR